MTPVRTLPAWLSLALLLTSCQNPTPPSEPLEPRVQLPGVQTSVLDKPAPSFTLPRLMTADSLRMEDFAGDVVLVNFWATWCAPCRVEIPDLVELHEELGPEGFHVVGILLEEESPDLARSFHETASINYPNAMDNDGAVARAFGGVWSLPASFLIDREGTVKRVIYGIVPFNSIRPQIDQLLASQ